MRPHFRLLSLLVPFLLAACEDPGSDDVVLVHASDPHVLDGKRTQQQTLNRNAFAAMMDAVRRGEAGTPAPRYLVITGDFGIEVTDPRYMANFARQAAATPNSVGAKAKFDEMVTFLDAQLRASRFTQVFFVPGNNDVFLEDARSTEWTAIPAFVSEMQKRLGPAYKFVDLTACYHPANPPAFDPRGCYARIDNPYVLVGFPSISFKNAGVDTAEYRLFIQGAVAGNSAAYRAEMERRVLSQDSLHQELLSQFQQVLHAATAGGWRAVVLTHIPDLDDPFAVGQHAAGAGQPTGLRLAPGREAWNVSNGVAAAWREAVEKPEVLGVLAGHFHDNHREVYYRPYPWSQSTRQSNPWKTFVTPPLAIKSQETSPVQARGFSVITLRGDSVRRRIHWYRQDSLRYQADPADEPTPGDGAAGRQPALSPGQRAARLAVLTIAVLAALVAMFWNDLSSLDAKARKRWLRRLMPIVAAAAVVAILIVVVQIAWRPGWTLWPSAAFWFVASGLLAALIRALVHRRRRKQGITSYQIRE